MAARPSFSRPARDPLVEYRAISVSITKAGEVTVRLATMDPPTRRMIHENLLLTSVEDASIAAIMDLLGAGLLTWSRRYPTQQFLGLETPQEGD